ncbi:YihY/virulence factor BrkB family protein [Qipengyuania flava]|uniref:YihY/virulence factor BrkB family protein n=1 Tax=Qipengyuania flava TaxID=192812 RepID=UPI001C62ADCC|nr:YihY/virulence factor BrkB family protein [Qipengyuania flava]QYJ07288.1 YihY/virulence factor BrkB family protein [Qipengyuania flava]
MLADLKAAWQASSDNNIGLIAAGMAHYALLALVPALGAIVLAYGLFADPETVASHITLLAQVLPASASELIGNQLQEVSEGASGTKGLGLLASLAVALFGARNGARSLMTGFNIVFHADSDRGLLRGNLVALAITAAGLVGLILAGVAGAALSNLAGVLGALASPVLVALGAAGAAALLLRFAPNAPGPSWRAIWPGAALFALAWMGATAAFAFYAANFGSYNATYGALGAVLALITWFWVTGFLLLLSAEIVAQRDRGA